MITTIIQARLSSTRLPRKVLLPLAGKTVLEHVVERVRKAKLIARVVVATSIQPEDGAIFDLCKKNNIDCVRGSLVDVLDRYYKVAKKIKAKNICRITADCPLIDPQLIDKVAKVFLKGGYDYISTGRIVSNFPDGLDTEVFTFKSLEKAWKEATLPSEREHVTPYIWKNSKIFKVFTINNKKNLSHIRLTIDEERDYLFLKKIIEHLKSPSWREVVTFLQKHPEIFKINSSIERDEGYKKSLKEDNL